jgi:hypothetical protein
MERTKNRLIATNNTSPKMAVQSLKSIFVYLRNLMLKIPAKPSQKTLADSLKDDNA